MNDRRNDGGCEVRTAGAQAARRFGGGYAKIYQRS